MQQECWYFSKVQEASRQIYKKSYPQPVAGGYFLPSAADQKENRAEAMNAYMLAFLGEVFSFVREKAMNRERSLGWSATFMKCGLAAFLLLLTESAGTETGVIQRGGREMLRQVTGAALFARKCWHMGCGICGNRDSGFYVP